MKQQALVLAVWLTANSLVAAQEPAFEPLTLEVAREVVAELLPEVERLRGLSFKEPVPVEVVDDAQTRTHLLARLRAFGQEESLSRMSRAYAVLGLIPEGADLLDLSLQLVEDQAGGFYDPGSGAYYLLGDMPAAAAPLFTAHELTHALEDQHYDLDQRLREVIGDDDALLARGAVHEGSATLLMSVYLTQAMLAGKLDATALGAVAAAEAAKQDKLARMPPVLLRQLIGPYVLGVHFLTRGNPLAVAQGYPAEAIDRAYRNGPVSSEQILHPAKYWNDAERDEPRAIEPTDAGRRLGRGWKPVAQGVLGELTIGVIVGAETKIDAGMLAMFDAGQWTNAAAAGWGGDRWELWERKGRSVVLLSTVWDTVDDAREFAAALPARRDLTWRRSDERVAVIAGDAGRRSARVLERMLAPNP